MEIKTPAGLALDLVKDISSSTNDESILRETDSFKTSLGNFNWLLERYMLSSRREVWGKYNYFKTNLEELKEGGYGEDDPDVILCKGIINVLEELFGING